jgi:glutathione S-transferase
VLIPMIMPKPDVIPLTGGYRKTPILQIGADIYCDTQLILRELERRFAAPSIFPYGEGLPYGIGFWVDRVFTPSASTLIFPALGDAVPESFIADREKLLGRPLSGDKLKAMAPFAFDLFRANSDFIASQLYDGRLFLQGPLPSAADIHCYKVFWWTKTSTPQILEPILKEFPAINAWISRMAAIGYGQPSYMDSKEALAVAKAATSSAVKADDPFDPRKFVSGQHVKVAADDYGRDEVEGHLVFSNAHEIAIARYHEAVGDVVVHFPRAGFVVTTV